MKLTRNALLSRLPLILLAVTLAFFLPVACERPVNNWVSYRTEVADYRSTTDSIAGAVIASAMVEAAYEALGGKPYKLYFDREENDKAVVSACNQVYSSSRDTVTIPFTIILKKRFSMSDVGSGYAHVMARYQYSKQNTL